MPKVSIVTALLLLGWCGSTRPLLAAEDSADDRLNPFWKGYLTLEIAKNNPANRTEERFEGGGLTTAFGYRHNLGAQWMMGLGFGFKSFKRRDGKGELAFATLTHESMRIFRVYHPTYLLVGAKIMYLLPAKRPNFPLLRAPEFETDVGAALSMALVRMVGERWLVSARIDRWRGTRTNRFHAIEAAVGVSYAIH